MTTYDRYRVLWPDHLGLARGKYLPARIAAKGTGHCASAFALGYDRSLVPAPGSYLLEGLKDVWATMDPDTIKPSWEDDRTAVAVATSISKARRTPLPPGMRCKRRSPTGLISATRSRSASNWRRTSSNPTETEAGSVGKHLARWSTERVRDPIPAA